MKIIFFGLGSIGQKHARILIQNYQHEIYAFRSKKNTKKVDLNVKEIYSWDEVEKLNPDIAFITNPTFLHTETAIKCAKLGCNLFIEKPVGKNLNDLDKLLNIVKKKQLSTYVAYSLRFHPVINYLKKYIKDKKPLHLRVVCSSFLPKWRPDRSVLDSYSANLDMGGGVILDLSHELDYVSYLLGGIDLIKGNYSRRGNVTVDAEDYADLLTFSGNVPANIHIDFLSQLRQRYIQLDFDRITLIGDITNSRIEEYKDESLVGIHKLRYSTDQEYITQIKYFLRNIHNVKMMNNLSEATVLFTKLISFKNNG